MKKKLYSVLIITTLVLTTAISTIPIIQMSADEYDDENGSIELTTDEYYVRNTTDNKIEC